MTFSAAGLRKIILGKQEDAGYSPRFRQINQAE
jgi:hypothetical protein